MLYIFSLWFSSFLPVAHAKAPVLGPDRPDHEVPNRAFDIQRLHLDLALEFEERSIGGTARYSIKRLTDKDFVLDQIDLDIRSVQVDGEDAPWETSGNHLVIDMPDRIERGGDAEVSIQYRATPRSGLHFRPGDRGGPDGYPEVWSQGQKNDNRYWFPAWDHPNDRFDYTGTVTGPEGWQITTNTGMNVPSYLIMLAAGKYTVVGDKSNQVWVGPNTSAEAIRKVKDPVPDMMEHFKERTGVAYPWDGYKQVFVQRFMYGGMENTSATINTDGVLVDADVDDTRDWIPSLVAHELAHQWYGDFLTCRSWRDLWLNEGFATFFAADWMASKDGPARQAVDAWRWNRSSQHREESMAGRFFHGEDASANRNVYSKGAMTLHMMRVMLGEDVFWAGIKDYTKGNALSLVRTSDLQASMERVSGQELGWFFQQWVELPYVPRLTVRSSHSDDKLTVSVSQEISDSRPRYTIPVTIEVGTEKGTEIHKMVLIEKSVELQIPMEKKPTYVAFDPQGGVLAKLTYEQEPEEWEAQLQSESPYAVLKAIRALSETDHSDGLSAYLADSSRSPLLRNKAAGALGDQRNTGALLPHMSDSSARVRMGVFHALGKGTTGEALPLLERRVRTEKNPDVRRAALEGVADLSKQRGAALARGLLNDKQMAGSAVNVLKEHGTIGDVSRLLDSRLRANVRTSGISAAARIIQRADKGAARDRAEDMTSDVLVGLLKDPDLRARQMAVRMLGSVGNTQAIDHLEVLRRAETVDSIASGVLGTIKDIRARERKVDEVAEDNKEDAKLKELEERLDELEKEMQSWKDKH